MSKLNPQGNRLLYSTYLGGSVGDLGRSIAVDSAGNAYLTGFSNSPNYPACNPLQTAYGGALDAFVTKLNAQGSALLYSSYFGGNNSDYGNSIALDSAGTVHLTGYTASPNLPTANPLQPQLRGEFDAFVAKIANTGEVACGKEEDERVYLPLVLR